MQRKLQNLRRSDEEAIKEAGLVLDFDEIAHKGLFSREETAIAKWYGIYQSRQVGNYMARVVIPGGQITSVQAKALAELAGKYGPGRISFTTRQSAQLHYLKMRELRNLLRDVAKANLTTFHGCGDVTRNVAACPWASICAHRRFDVLPYAKETARFLAGCRDLDNLPRKFKITFSGCSGNCAQPHINCVGAIAAIRKRPDGTAEQGFRVLIGGGMGWKPFIGQELYSFVPAEAITQPCRAIGILFRDHGDRFNRAKSRLKFVVHRYGIDKCREIVNHVLDREGVDQSRFEVDPIEEAGQPVPDRPLAHTKPIGTDGQAIQGIMIPKGEISTEHLLRIAELSEIYADKHVYSTNRQNLELHGVDQKRLAELRVEIEKLGPRATGFHGLQDVVTCVGTTYCPLAVANTHEMFDRLQDLVHQDKYAPIRERVLINITGCPNSCSPYRIADIGLRGMRIQEREGSTEGFQITIGGTEDQFGEVLGEFKQADCMPVITRILDTFLEAAAGTSKQQRPDSTDTGGQAASGTQASTPGTVTQSSVPSPQSCETLADHVRRVEIDFYKQAIADLATIYEKAPKPQEFSVFARRGAASLDFKTIAKDIPCQEACPAHTDVPEYIRRIARGDLDGAHRVNQEDNVFPGVLGRVCTRPCETACRHNWTGTQGPVRICHLKRSAADGKSIKSKPLPAWFPPTGKKVAIVGGGPAGLTAARELKRFGHDVTIFEREPYLGGQMRISIPIFRLPREVLDEDIDAIVDSGVQTRMGQNIDAERMGQLLREFDVVLVTAGAMKPNALGLPGLPEGLAIEGLRFMKMYNLGVPPKIAGDVIVIGGGFTAVDCARSARRLLGPANRVSIMYRRSEAQMSASPDELEELRRENIEVQTLVTPVSAVIKDGRLKAVTFQRDILGKDRDGSKPQITLIPDSEFDTPCDALIVAIGQTRMLEILPEGVSLAQDHRTNLANLFVAGDFATGNRDVIHGVAEGKAAACQIDEFLTGQKRRIRCVHIDPADDIGRLRDMDLLTPPPMPTLPAGRRARGMEVELGFGLDARQTNAQRCYLCHYKFEIDQDKCIHCDWCIKVSPRECIRRVSKLELDVDGAEIGYSEVPAGEPEKATFIWIDSNNCIRCGNCLRACPTEAISLRKADMAACNHAEMEGKDWEI